MPCTDGCGFCRVVVSGLSVKKGGETLLDDINLEMNCGELTALIGSNGAGKTTLLRAILGEISHDGVVRHEDCTGETIEKITIGYVPQFLDFDRTSPVSVEDFLFAGRSKSPVWFHKNKKIREQILCDLQKVGCEKLINRPLGKLSGGELQRVMLVQALTPNPELLILDEPVSGVDEAGTEMFYKTIHTLIHERHMAAALVSHDLSLVRQYADKVVLLNKKVLREGSVDDVFASEEFRKELASGL